MNYLAHAALSGRPGPLMLGNLMADAIKGRLPESLPDGVRDGIAMHRAIDRFTDRHPLFKRSCARLPDALSRFAGVMVDIYYDHFLARHWGRLHQGDLSVFAASVYELLRRHRRLLPPRLARFHAYMESRDLLVAYAHRPVIHRTFRHLSKRLKRRNPLAEGGRQLDLNYRRIERDFLAFYPQLHAHARELRITLQADGHSPGPLQHAVTED